MKTVRQFLTELAESKKELNVDGSIILNTTYNSINNCNYIIKNKTIDMNNIKCCFVNDELDNYKVIAALEMDNHLFLKVELIKNKTDKEIEIL